MEGKAIPTGFKRKIPSDDTKAPAEDDNGPDMKILKCLNIIYREAIREEDAYEEVLNDKDMLLGYRRKISGDKTKANYDNVLDSKISKSLKGTDVDNDDNDLEEEEEVWDDDALSIGSEVIIDDTLDDDLDELGEFYEHCPEECDESAEEEGVEEEEGEVDEGGYDSDIDEGDNDRDIEEDIDDSDDDLQETEQNQESTYETDNDMDVSDDYEDEVEVESASKKTNDDENTHLGQGRNEELEEDILNMYLDDTVLEDALEKMNAEEKILESEEDGEKVQEIPKNQVNHGELDQNFLNRFLEDSIQENSLLETTNINMDILEFDYAELETVFNEIVPFEDTRAMGDSASHTKVKDIHYMDEGFQGSHKDGSGDAKPVVDELPVARPDFIIEMGDKNKEGGGDTEFHIDKMIASIKTYTQSVISQFNDLAEATAASVNQDSNEIMTVVDKEDLEGNENCAKAEVPLIPILQYDDLKSLQKAVEYFSKDVMNGILPAMGSLQSQLEALKDYFATPNPENFFDGIIPKEEVDKALADEEEPLFIASLQQVKIKEKEASEDYPYIPKNFFKKILLEDADPVLLQEAIKMYNENHSVHPQAIEEHTASASAANQNKEANETSACLEMRTKEANNASALSIKPKHENDEGFNEAAQQVDKEKEKVTETINLVDVDDDVIEISDDEEVVEETTVNSYPFDGSLTRAQEWKFLKNLW